MDLREFFGPGGPLADNLEGFEPRTEQVDMALAVAAAFENDRRLMVEAGCGVGKSFAYLVPAIGHAMSSGEQVFVSTHTISLQEQLASRDIPLVVKAMGGAPRFALAKGRSNYLCHRRFRIARDAAGRLFESDPTTELDRIARWAAESPDGDRAGLEPQPKREVWSQVCSDAHSCRGRECSWADSCFFRAARKRVFGANLVVVNHALLMADLSVKIAGSRVLPAFKCLVVDEAHDLERAAESHLGEHVSQYMLNRLLNALWNPQNLRGLLSGRRVTRVLKKIEKAAERAREFFEAVEDWTEGPAAPRNLRVRKPGFVPDLVSDDLSELGKALSDLVVPGADEEEQFEVFSLGRRALEAAQTVRDILSMTGEGRAFWVERGEGRGRGRCSLRAAPLRVGDVLEPTLFSTLDSAVLTSATLAVGGDEPFAYFADRLGFEGCETALLGSPFDFEAQAKLVIPKGMPDPRDDAFPEAISEAILRAVEYSRGRAFVLFTSYAMMRRVRDLTETALDALGCTLMVQGESRGRAALLDDFRTATAPVLFGTASFWEGVDIRGDALSNVVITRLPFQVPDHPLVEARTERIELEGGNAFMEYTVPEAVIRFKQGFGRLIRSRSDRGTVVVLDRRILDKPYGRRFLESIPKLPLLRNLPGQDGSA